MKIGFVLRGCYGICVLVPFAMIIGSSINVVMSVDFLGTFSSPPLVSYLRDIAMLIYLRR